MKVKFLDQSLVTDFTFAVGVNQSEIVLPTMVAGDAALVKGVAWSLDSASAAPSITAAGLAIFSAALVGKAQASPADLLDLDELLWSRFYTMGATGALFLIPNHEWSYHPNEKLQWPINPTRELFVFGHTVNVTNAATTIMKLHIVYDVVTLTASEQLAYLL